MANKGPFIQTDKFNNPYQVVGLKNNKGGFPVGYVELGNKLYKLEPSEAKGDGKYVMWCRVTQVKKKANHSTM